MHIEELKGKLVITDFDEFEAYRLAAKIEKDGIGFYKKMLALAKDAGAKESLEFLVAEEIKHLKFFEECLYKLKERNEEAFEDDNLLGSLDYGIFQINFQPEWSKDFIGGMKAVLDLGIKIEDRSIALYEACRKEVSAKATKKEIGNIIEEERRHKALLESMRF